MIHTYKNGYNYKGFNYIYRPTFHNYEPELLYIRPLNDENIPNIIEFPNEIEGRPIRDINQFIFLPHYISFDVSSIKCIILPGNLYFSPQNIFYHNQFNSLKYVKLSNIWLKYNEDKWIII